MIGAGLLFRANYFKIPGGRVGVNEVFCKQEQECLQGPPGGIDHRNGGDDPERPLRGLFTLWRHQL